CASRPTAVNLRWAVERIREHVSRQPKAQRATLAWQEAQRIAEEDVALNQAIGTHGATLLAQQQAQTQRRLNILTHCNTGWLATVDYGTALSAIYQAFDAGIDLHVWVSETRPRNQGLLTAWELDAHGVPYTLVADNAAGHLMQTGQVDCVLVGADRVSAAGDVCNKVGTYLKAMTAHDCGVPFYVAVPTPTIDWSWPSMQAPIPIEQRSGDELRLLRGTRDDGQPAELRIAPPQVAVYNPAFDLTPARLVTALITEKGNFTAHTLPAVRTHCGA
ncbi:MAG TPA: S-methyl-5-thioribose-1-phosphate isomerase, partial [Burkholderiaceae bacterium]|nr:S-methyl-5-thioribose-1-phosphate isomerase [Burkholderiaceae bacterium]